MCGVTYAGILCVTVLFSGVFLLLCCYRAVVDVASCVPLHQSVSSTARVQITTELLCRPSKT